MSTEEFKFEPGEMSASIDQLAPDLVNMQKELPSASKKEIAKIKTRTGGEFSYTYADLDEVISTMRPVLFKHNFALLHLNQAGDGVTQTLRVMLIHKSGQWLSGYITLKPTEATPQSAGSAITFGRRYSAQCITGQPSADDDGKEASKEPEQKKAAPSADFKKALAFEAKVMPELNLMIEGKSELTMEAWLQVYAPEFRVTCEKDEVTEVGTRLWDTMLAAAAKDKISKAKFREMYRQYREAEAA